MNSTNLKLQILSEIENLISNSYYDQENYETLHIAIIKKYYNATDVAIDHTRKRISMQIIMDDNDYVAASVNLSVPTLYTSIPYENFGEFLKDCVGQDNKSISFYNSLLKHHTRNHSCQLSYA